MALKIRTLSLKKNLDVLIKQNAWYMVFDSNFNSVMDRPKGQPTDQLSDLWSCVYKNINVMGIGYLMFYVLPFSISAIFENYLTF